MKKVILSASLLVGITATAQVDYEKRVGVNTDKPRASLEVRAIVSGNKAQGILFPHISEDEKAEWLKDEAKGLVAGTVIWNTTKLCLDYFDGTNWQCTDGTKTNVHPTKWTPGSSSFTGKAVWGDDAGEVISIAKNNCPAGQTGVLLNYPANTAQQITYTATSNVSQADANQKAIDLMNSAIEAAKRQALAQEYANANGTCRASSTTYTGTAIWGDDANEVINATKNNCPAGQKGSTVTYPANTAQYITYTATSNVSQADANQKAIDLMNSAEKQQERQTVAQDYANVNGSCQSVFDTLLGKYSCLKDTSSNSGRDGILIREHNQTSLEVVSAVGLTGDGINYNLNELPKGKYYLFSDYVNYQENTVDREYYYRNKKGDNIKRPGSSRLTMAQGLAGAFFHINSAVPKWSLNSTYYGVYSVQESLGSPIYTNDAPIFCGGEFVIE